MSRRIGDPKGCRRHYIMEWRQFRGMTQQDLADALNADKSTISKVENRRQGYTQSFLEACAEALGTSPYMLLWRAPDERDMPTAAAPAPVIPAEPMVVDGNRRIASRRRVRNGRPILDRR